MGIKFKNGSLTLNEETARSVLAAREALRAGGEREIYDAYLHFRAVQYDFNPREMEGRALTRIASMARFEDGPDGSARERAHRLSKVFGTLSDGQREVLIRELNESGFDGGAAIVPYHAPAMMNRLLSAFKTQPDGFERAMKLGMETLADVFRRARSQMGSQREGAVYCYLHQVAELARNPELLRRMIFPAKFYGKNLQVIPREDPTSLESAKSASPIVSAAARGVSSAHPLFDSISRSVNKFEREIGEAFNRALSVRLQAADGRAGLYQSGTLPLRDNYREIHGRFQLLSHRLAQLALFGASELPALDFLDAHEAERHPHLASRMREHMRIDPARLEGEARLDHSLEGLRLRLERFWHAVPENLKEADRPQRIYRQTVAGLDSIARDVEKFRAISEEARHVEAKLVGSSREFGKVVLEESPTIGLCQELGALLAPNRFRPVDPRIHDRGISVTEQNLAKFEDLLSKGARLLTVRGEGERVLGYALWFDPADSGKRDAAAPGIYRNYGSVAFFHFIAVSTESTSVPVYALALESVALHLPGADVACGRVQEDNFRAFIVHGCHGLQLYIPDAATGKSDLPTDPFALFPGRESTRSIGILLAIAPRWRDEFALTGLSWREAYEQANGIIERRYPGVTPNAGQALFDAWNSKRVRKEFLNLQIEVHQMFPIDEHGFSQQMQSVWDSLSARATFGEKLAAVAPADRAAILRDLFAPGRHADYGAFYFDARGARETVYSMLKPLQSLVRESAEIGVWQAQVREDLERQFGSEKCAVILSAFEEEVPIWRALDLRNI
jgi:hypothetical protein